MSNEMNPTRHRFNRGRPKTSDPKDGIVRVRVTASEREALQGMAKAGNMTMSQLLLRGALAIGPKLEQAAALAPTVDAIGRELNELVKRANAAGPTIEDRRTVADRVEALHDVIAPRITATPALGKSLTRVANLLRQWRRHGPDSRADAAMSRIDDIVASAAP
jgi:hypothetical protein